MMIVIFEGEAIFPTSFFPRNSHQNTCNIPSRSQRLWAWCTYICVHHAYDGRGWPFACIIHVFLAPGSFLPSFSFPLSSKFAPQFVTTTTYFPSIPGLAIALLFLPLPFLTAVLQFLELLTFFLGDLFVSPKTRLPRPSRPLCIQILLWKLKLLSFDWKFLNVPWRRSLRGHGPLLFS